MSNKPRTTSAVVDALNAGRKLTLADVADVDWGDTYPAVDLNTAVTPGRYPAVWANSRIIAVTGPGESLGWHPVEAEGGGRAAVYHDLDAAGNCTVCGWRA